LVWSQRAHEARPTGGQALRGQGGAPRRRRPGLRWRADRCHRAAAAGASGARAPARARPPSSAAASRLLARPAGCLQSRRSHHHKFAGRARPGAPAAWSASAISESRGHAPAAAAPLHAASSPLHTRSTLTPCPAFPIFSRCCWPPGAPHGGHGKQGAAWTAGASGRVARSRCCARAAPRRGAAGRPRAAARPHAAARAAPRAAGP